MSIDYAAPGVFTDLSGVEDSRFEGVGGTAPEICRSVPTLFVQPSEAEGLAVPRDRFEVNQVRAAADLTEALWAIEPVSLAQPRKLDQRAVGTCRHFTVLSVALLRRAGIPARARCGFATYFQPGLGLDHWIVEWRSVSGWVRMDTEILGSEVLEDARELRDGQFLSGAEAWSAFRRGEVDASAYGVYGTENFGPSEIRGNLVRDLAALVKVESLPWDEWGRMTAAYEGATGVEYDELLDQVAAAINADDPEPIESLSTHPDLHPPFAA